MHLQHALGIFTIKFFISQNEKAVIEETSKTVVCGNEQNFDMQNEKTCILQHKERIAGNCNLRDKKLKMNLRIKKTVFCDRKVAVICERTNIVICQTSITVFCKKSKNVICKKRITVFCEMRKAVIRLSNPIFRSAFTYFKLINSIEFEN